MLFLSLLFFLSRLTNILSLPIFNDEAIYLDWGWREVHTAMHFYSLYDAKPPLLMWIFGTGESIISNPLLAGRIVSTLTGFLLFLGLWKISRLLFDKKTAVISALLYCIIPIFLFYDRQALMESAVAAAGIWSCYFFFSYIQTHKMKNLFLTGILLSIGFWIKYSILLYVITIVFSLVIEIIRNKEKIKKITELILMLIAISFVCVTLLIQSAFFSTLGLDTTYSLNISELFRFPINIWAKNTSGNLQIIFFFFTPFVFIFSLLGIILLLKSKKKENRLFCALIIIPLVLETLTVRTASIRYVASFLPLFIIPAAYGFVWFMKNNLRFGMVAFVISLSLPISASLLQIANSTEYIKEMAKLTHYSPAEYVTGITSGSGTNIAIDYINSLAKKQKILVMIAPHTGNPESALAVYLRKSENVIIGSVNANEIGDSINNIDCIDTGKPTYFIARGVELENLNKYFQKIKTISIEDTKQTIDIYQTITNCKGTKAQINILN